MKEKNYSFAHISDKGGGGLNALADMSAKNVIFLDGFDVFPKVTKKLINKTFLYQKLKHVQNNSP